MNRRLIIRMLGALLLIEAAAMVPALLIALWFRSGDASALGYSILINIVAGSALSFLPGRDRDSHLRLKEGFIITALGWIFLGLSARFPLCFPESFRALRKHFLRRFPALPRQVQHCHR